jgi:hypothetical protein
MPLSHLQGRRKRDRLELNMAAIDAREHKLEDLPVELQPFADAAKALAMDWLSFNGADTFDRGDLFAIGLGATIMRQVLDHGHPSLHLYAYEIVMQAVAERIALIEEGTRDRR